MNFQPVRDKVLIEPDKRKEKTEGGLIIPDKAQKDEGRGTVIAVSADIENPCVKPGDKVIYTMGRKFDIEQDGKIFHNINYDDIEAKM